jgi:hypothetical protein
MAKRRWLTFFVAMAAFSSPYPLAHDAHAPAKDITVRGEILDMACYLSHGDKGRGPEHQQCALKCAQMGQPLGLITTDGKLYLLTADHQDPTAFRKAKEFAGQKVEMTGAVAEKDGVAALTVHAVKK